MRGFDNTIRYYDSDHSTTSAGVPLDSAAPNQSTAPSSSCSNTATPSTNYSWTSSASGSNSTLSSAGNSSGARPPPKKKHVCPTCDRGFTTARHRARYVRVHTGERNHKCPFPGCETRCSRQDNVHQQCVHLIVLFTSQNTCVVMAPFSAFPSY